MKKSSTQFNPLHSIGFFWIIIGICIFGMVGCKTLKPLPPDSTIKSSPKDEGSSRPKQQKKDTTILNAKSDPLQKDKTTQPSNNSSDKAVKQHKNAVKNVVEVGVILPLDGSYEIGRFATLINGMNIAAASMASNTPQVNINVINVGNESDPSKLWSNPMIKKSDILVGGFQTSQVKAIGGLAQERGIPYLSIFNSADDLMDNSPLYFQIKPSLVTYCQAISDHILSKVKPQKIVVICRSKTSKDYVCKDYFNQILANSNIPIIFTTDEDQKNNSWTQALTPTEKISIIVPIWEDPKYITDLTKRIANLINKDSEVIGMPQWLDIDNIDFDIWTKLNLKLPIFNYVDKSSVQYEMFSNEYFKHYNDFPTENATMGYDLINMIGQIAHAIDKGVSINPSVQVSGYYLSNYVMEPVYNSFKGSEMSKVVNYYKNKYITILKFTGGQFEPIQ